MRTLQQSKKMQTIEEGVPEKHSPPLCYRNTFQNLVSVRMKGKSARSKNTAFPAID